MRQSLFTLLILFFFFPAIAQEEQAENTGDNFSLEGALDLFKKASTLEEFERLLNQEENNVNNLDLNDDGEIDYIVVNAMKEGDAHAIVLSTYLKEDELQDIAVIGIEKEGPESAYLQIEGDTDLFPENTIAEPIEDAQAAIRKMNQSETMQGLHSDLLSATGSSSNEASYANGFLQQERRFLNVWHWPCVRFIYAPGYVAWRSPWRWGLYPSWWKSRRPLTYSVFYGRGTGVRIFYRRVPGRSVTVARRIYIPGRRHSTFVVHKNKRGAVIVKKKRGGRAKVVRVKRGRGRRF